MSEGLIHHSLLSNIHILRTMSQEDLIELVEDLQGQLESIEEEWKEQYDDLDKMYDKMEEKKDLEIAELELDIKDIQQELKVEERENFNLRQTIGRYFNEHPEIDNFWDEINTNKD